MSEKDECTECDEHACRHCLRVARRIEARLVIMSASSYRWKRHVEQMQCLVKQLEAHAKWKSYATLPLLAVRLCSLATQAAPFDAAVSFDMDLLAADLLYYVCHKEVLAADALQQAAYHVYFESEPKAMLLLGVASDMCERNGAYSKALSIERLAFKWARQSDCAFATLPNVMRLRRERIRKLRRRVLL